MEVPQRESGAGWPPGSRQAGFVTVPDARTSEQEERLPLPFQSGAHVNRVCRRKGVSRTNSL